MKDPGSSPSGHHPHVLLLGSQELPALGLAPLHLHDPTRRKAVDLHVHFTLIIMETILAGTGRAASPPAAGEGRWAHCNRLSGIILSSKLGRSGGSPFPGPIAIPPPEQTGYTGVLAIKAV